MPVKPEEEPRTSDLEQYVKQGDVPTQSRNDLNLKYIANEKKIPGQLLHTRMKRKLLHASQHQRKLHMRKKNVEKRKT